MEQDKDMSIFVVSGKMDTFTGVKRLSMQHLNLSIFARKMDTLKAETRPVGSVWFWIGESMIYAWTHSLLLVFPPR